MNQYLVAEEYKDKNNLLVLDNGQSIDDCLNSIKLHLTECLKNLYTYKSFNGEVNLVDNKKIIYLYELAKVNNNKRIFKLIQTILEIQKIISLI